MYMYVCKCACSFLFSFVVGFDLVNDGPISATVRAFCTSTGDIVFGRSLESKCLLSCDTFMYLLL